MADMVKTGTPGIYKRGSRYVIVWRDRGKQHKQFFRTMAEAREAKGKRATGETQAATNARFDDYAEGWLKTYRGRKPSRGITNYTRKSYERAIKKHAIPFFGRQRLRDIRPKDIEAFVAHLQEEGAGTPSVRAFMVALKVLFATAYQHGDIAANPTQGVSLDLAPTPTKVKVMTRAELGLVLAALPEAWQPFFRFLAQTGLRISEAIGLRWEDVELGAAPHVKVRRQIYKGETRDLKTRHSVRDVPLTPGMRDTLLALRGRRYGGPEAPLWPTTAGTPMAPHNLRKRVLTPAVAALGMEWVGFHTFRHTCASLLFAGGRDVKQVQKWLGHADPGFTLRTYVHLMDEGLGSADFLDDVVRGQSAGGPPSPDGGAAILPSRRDHHPDSVLGNPVSGPNHRGA